jgi:hydrogenase maturation protease
VVAAIGSDFRHDDGVGPQVVKKVAEVPGRRDGVLDCVDALGDPIDLLGVWDGCDLAVVVDATRSGVPPGSIRIVELDDAAAVLPSISSTHGLGVAAVLALSRAVGRAPRRVVLVGIEGTDFTMGQGLTSVVGRSVDEARDAVLSLIAEATPCA